MIFVVFTCIYLLVFHLPILADQRVLFYRGVGLLIFTFVFNLFLFLLLNKFFRFIEYQTLFAALFISFAFNLTFFVVFPVTFDRSVTMFLLNTIENEQEHNKAQMSRSDLEEKFISDYVLKNKAIERRIKEQSIIDIIEYKNNSINLTNKGFVFLKFSRIVGKLYNLD